jgi:hypothetical protein
MRVNFTSIKSSFGVVHFILKRSWSIYVLYLLDLGRASLLMTLDSGLQHTFKPCRFASRFLLSEPKAILAGSLSIQLNPPTSSILIVIKIAPNLMMLSLLSTQYGNKGIIGLGTHISLGQGDDAQSFVGCQGFSQCYTRFNSALFQAQKVFAR